MESVHEYVKRYLDRGLAPIPVPYRTKEPVIAGWPDLRVTKADISKLFTLPCNVGVLLGTASEDLSRF